MKEVWIIILGLITALFLSACGGNGGQAEALPSGTPEILAEESPEAETIILDPEPGNVEATPQPEAEGTNILVAYFSATGTTKAAAETIAESLGADIYEISPEEPYTEEDLDYNDYSSRATLEMNDPSARPAISGQVENMEQYDVLFLGYPIWWGDAPRIIWTFVESYDLSGKTIVPFCTSGSSGIDTSAEGLKALAEAARWLPGRRLNGSSTEDISQWLSGLELEG